jgi:hypothetical protein
MNKGRKCEDCGVFTFNEGRHQCVKYEGPPCEYVLGDGTQCGKPTVYATLGAPGIGGHSECTVRHITNDTGRTLEPWETE